MEGTASFDLQIILCTSKIIILGRYCLKRKYRKSGSALFRYFCAPVLNMEDIR